MLHVRQIPSALSLASMHKLLAMLAADAKRAQDEQASQAPGPQTQQPSPPTGAQCKRPEGGLPN